MLCNSHPAAALQFRPQIIRASLVEVEFHDGDQMKPGLEQMGTEGAKNNGDASLSTGGTWDVLDLVSGLIELLVSLLL